MERRELSSYKSWAALARTFEKDSFNARITGRRFTHIAADNPVTAGDKPTLRYGTMQLYERCERTSDLRFFVTLFLEHGNNILKTLARVEASDAEVIKRKCEAYGIDYRTASSNKLPSDVLTLSRIARAFPVHTALEILKSRSRGILTDSKFFKQELPLVMQHNIFPGLIPSRQFKEDLRRIALVLNMEMSIILSSAIEQLNMKNKTVQNLIQSSVKYVDNADENSCWVYDDADKLRLLTEAGILNAKDNGEFELSATTMELKVRLPAIEAVYSLTYSDAVRQLKSN